MATGYTGQRPQGKGRDMDPPSGGGGGRGCFCSAALDPVEEDRESTFKVPPSSLKDNLGRGRLHTVGRGHGASCAPMGVALAWSPN